MLWARMLSYVTGTVNQELLLRNEYLGAENRILRGQIKGRLLLSEGEKATLAEIAQRLGRIRRWATFSVGMASLLLLRENRPSAGKTLSVHTWKFWSGRIFSLWKCLP